MNSLTLRIVRIPWPTIRLPVALLVSLLAACTHPRDASRAILAQVDASLESTTTLAIRFAPKELEEAQAKVASLHASFDARLYERILSDGPVVLEDIHQLQAFAEGQRNSRRQAEWMQLLDAVPAMQRQVRVWIDLQRTRKKTSSPELEQFEQELSQAASMWEMARSDYVSLGAQADIAPARSSASRTLILLYQTLSAENKKP